MDTNHKGKGFMRGKLSKAKSLLRMHSKPCMPTQFSSNKVSPSPRRSNGSLDLASLQSHPPSTQRESSVQPQPTSMPVQYSNKVSPNPYAPNYTSMDFPTSQSIHKVSAAQLRSFHDFNGDENVDMKAASYILHVRERFKLERVDSEIW